MTPSPEKKSVLSPATLRCTGALLSAQAAVASLIDREAVAPIGQDPTIVDLLVRLDQAPDNRLRAIELSRQLKLSPSHISRTLDRAEEAGLVARGQDPDDRRASRISLTPAGREVIEQFAPRIDGLIERVVFETLSDAEIDTLVDLLGRLEAAACQPGQVGTP